MKTLIILLTMFLSGASATFAVDAPQFQDGDRWEFNARRKAGVTSTSDTLSGNYEIIYTQGRLEVFQIVEGQKTETRGETPRILRDSFLSSRMICSL